MNLGLSDSIIHVLPSMHMDQVPTLWLLEPAFWSAVLWSATCTYTSVCLSESAFELLHSCLMRT